jgi:hypothetical protein
MQENGKRANVMPLPEGTRYRWKTNPDGTKIRLAFKGGKVIEVKKQGGVARDLRSKAESQMKKGK